MITLTTKTYVAGMRARQITDFLLYPSDESYQRWWPGTHLRFHAIERVEGDVGNLVYVSQIVGRRRIRIVAELVEVEPASKLVWQMRKGVRLPVRFALELDEDLGGVDVTHTITAGFARIGRVFDPLLRLYFSPAFCKDIDEHVRVEFIKLPALLRERASRSIRVVK